MEVNIIGRRYGWAQTKCAPSFNSNHGCLGATAARGGSAILLRNKTAFKDKIRLKTNEVEAPAHAINAPANAGPAAKAMLRANSKRPLARAKCSEPTRAGTKEGAPTLKPTVPTEDRKSVV